MKVTLLSPLPRNQVEQNDHEYQADRPMRNQAKHKPKAKALNMFVKFVKFF